MLNPSIRLVPGADGESLKFSRLLVDASGHDGALPFEISNSTSFNNAWMPPLRTHSWQADTVGAPYRVGSGSRSSVMHVRESGSLPTEDSKLLEDAVKQPKPDLSRLSTLQLLHLAERRLYDIRPEAWLAAGTKSTGWYPIMRQDVLAVLRRYEASGAKQPDEPSVRRRAADLARVAGQAATALPDLSKGLDPKIYVGNTGKQAVQIVNQAIGSTLAAVAMSWADNPDVLADLEARAMRHRMALPYDLAGLYLKTNMGVEAVQNQTRDVSYAMWAWRGKADLTDSRPMDKILGITYASGTPAGSMTLGQPAAAFEAARDAFFTGAVDVFGRLGDLSQRTQREAGLFSLFALYAQMTWFRKELDSWLDTAVGVLPGTNERQRPLAEDYRVKFGALVTEVEAAWKGSWDPKFETAVDGVVKRFVDLVDTDKFTKTVETIQARLETIEVIKIVGKVLALVAVASLAAWAAGAGIASMLAGIGRGLLSDRC